MTTAIPANQDLRVLEALRVHRKKHRKELPAQITAHIEQPIEPLTFG